MSTHRRAVSPRVVDLAAAHTAGGSLALMAVLSPIAVFWAIGSGEETLAGFVMTFVVLLDVNVAVTLPRALDPQMGQLATIAMSLRLVYTAALVVAVSGLLGASSPAAFESIWDPALMVFGFHLLAIALLGWRTLALPVWLAGLIALAGLGYVIDVVLMAAGSSVEVSTFTFVGEAVLFIWLITRRRPAEPIV